MRAARAALSAVVVVAVLAWGLGPTHGDQMLEGRLVTPLMGWTSSGAYFADDQAAEALQLQATSDPAATLADLVGSIIKPATPNGKTAAASLLNAAGLADAAPEVVLVLLGSQLRTTDLRRKRAASLQKIVQGAASSVALPYVTHPQQAAGGDLRRTVEQRLEGVGAELLTAGCGEGLSLATLPQLLADATVRSSAPLVVLGCTTVAPGDSGTDAGLEGELQQVAAAHAALSAHGRRAVTLLAVDPHGAAQDSGAVTVEQRRRLLAAGAAVGYTECDARCKTQVKWLQGMLALLLLIVATLSGLCCLSVLDTPTRFEAPKDASRSD